LEKKIRITINKQSRDIPPREKSQIGRNFPKAKAVRETSVKERKGRKNEGGTQKICWPSLTKGDFGGGIRGEVEAAIPRAGRWEATHGGRKDKKVRVLVGGFWEETKKHSYFETHASPTRVEREH